MTIAKEDTTILLKEDGNKLLLESDIHGGPIKLGKFELPAFKFE